jgi:hypothetical protein
MPAKTTKKATQLRILNLSPKISQAKIAVMTGSNSKKRETNPAEKFLRL